MRAIILTIIFIVLSAQNSKSSETAVDSLHQRIVSLLQKEFKTIKKSENFSLPSGLFRNNKQIKSFEEFHFKAKKSKYVKGYGNMKTRLAYGVFHFKNDSVPRALILQYLSYAEADTNKFLRDSASQMKSPPLLMVNIDSFIFFIYVRCEDYPKDKRWESFIEIFKAAIRKSGFIPKIAVQCSCGGPVTLLSGI